MKTYQRCQHCQDKLIGNVSKRERICSNCRAHKNDRRYAGIDIEAIWDKVYLEGITGEAFRRRVIEIAEGLMMRWIAG